MTTIPASTSRSTTRITRRASGAGDTRIRLLGAALAAAERGWPVFPLRPGEKTPALHGARRCRRSGPCAVEHQGWEQRATTDRATITGWWRVTAWNVGIACGPAGLVVVDLDVAKPEGPDPSGVAHGGDTLRRLAAEAGAPAPWDTYTTLSPSGGLHLYFRAPAGAPVRNTTGGYGHRGLGPLVDIRAHGGYIVAAGSVLRRPGGARSYRARPGRPDLAVPLPGWLHTALTRPPTTPPAPGAGAGGDIRHRDAYVRAAIAGETTTIRQAGPGGRAFVVFKAAARLGELVGAGLLTAADAHQALHTAAAVHNGIAGWSPREAEHHITNGLAAGHTRPRRPHRTHPYRTGP